MRNKERNFGRRVCRDPRDNAYSVYPLLRRKKSQRTYRYWSDIWWSGNQGVMPACVGFAWAHWLANYPMKQWLDPVGLYKMAQVFDEWPGENYEGTSVRAGAKVLKHLGFIKEYRWATTVEQIINTVLEIGPVVVGTEWYEGMNEPNSKGLIMPEGDLMGGHAYLLNGVNTKKQTFRMKQSWGSDWGDKGHAELSFEAMNTLLDYDGECCLAVEQSPQSIRLQYA